MSEVATLTENDVIDAVCRYLEDDGYEIRTRATTKQTGDDIVASKASEQLIIEAKGATSAESGSARYGKPFNSGQSRTHVAVAILRTLQVMSRAGEGHNLRSGIALPATPFHQREIQSVQPVLAKLQIPIFWVNGSGSVDLA